MSDLLARVLLALLLAVSWVGGVEQQPTRRAHNPETAGASPAPATTSGSVGTALISGWAGWASPSHGPDYLATRFPRGTRVRLCAASCLVMTVTDYGPDPRLRPVRVADIAVGRWRVVCGLPASRGVCLVTIETVPALPATDTE